MATTTTRTTITHTDELEVWPCSDCGIIFAIPRQFGKDRRTDGRAFYCPNGHVLSWKETVACEVVRLKAEKATLEKRVTNTEKWAKDAQALAEREQFRHELTRRSLASTRGQVTKLKKRVGNGVCPCCRRSFQQLARHMKAQHPGFAETESQTEPVEVT